MSTDQEKVFEVICPCCQATLWVDPSAQSVIKSEKGAKKKASLDDLLLKEKKKKEGFEHKFEATAEIEKQKRQKAKEKFAKAFGDLDKTD
jgi:hypothetical protein